MPYLFLYLSVKIHIVRSDSPIEVEVHYMTVDGGEFGGKAAGKVYRP